MMRQIVALCLLASAAAFAPAPAAGRRSVVVFDAAADVMDMASSSVDATDAAVMKVATATRKMMDDMKIQIDAEAALTDASAATNVVVEKLDRIETMLSEMSKKMGDVAMKTDKIMAEVMKSCNHGRGHVDRIETMLSEMSKKMGDVAMKTDKIMAEVM
eukprot:CAMPEP_0206831006 /NCGR_PEP_ID=MMETSP0975-20121206/17165_1 /ASSEMBLY_ACC=CAM_ASM_000399 /TAXON_ID=483370 /ORGANISM="non described non described, Strain CCMP2097" /LENGTH=158 /DNA_ID=CAMNT_0054373375 /DNA_START=41 /DNA_END=518 /DNA_ORIENTATION=-